MKCYYEVLEVSEDANDDEIKKSYRKLALKWHPDKNLDNASEAKERFQLIQQAYDVLSDPQERSWYDKHKDSLLKGGLDDDYEDDSLNVYAYFTASCFKGYNDDEKGFYTVYNEVFKKIGAEDLEFSDELDIPEFGNSTSPYAEVVHVFYSYWMSYSTKKSYAWLDEYDIRQAPNGRVVKLMEKENKKIRDKARKERNEEVRALVSFVRKRDKRVQEYAKLLEQKSLDNERKVEELRKKQIRERNEEMKNYVESDWTKFSNVMDELKQIESQLVEEVGEEEDSLFCSVCNKLFKTPNAFHNHEKSKKHQENIRSLQESQEDELHPVEEDPEEPSEKETPLTEEETQLTDEEVEAKPKKKKKRKKDIWDPEEQMNSVSSDTELTLEEIEKLRNPKKFDPPKKTPKAKKKDKKKAEVTQSNHLNEEEIQPIDEIETEPKQKSKKNTPKPDVNAGSPDAESTQDEALQKAPKSKKKDKKLEDTSKQNNCKVCKEEFKSKNELFKHLKASGHAIFIPETTNNDRKSSKGVVKKK